MGLSSAKARREASQAPLREQFIKVRKLWPAVWPLPSSALGSEPALRQQVHCQGSGSQLAITVLLPSRPNQQERTAVPPRGFATVPMQPPAFSGPPCQSSPADFTLSYFAAGQGLSAQAARFEMDAESSQEGRNIRVSTCWTTPTCLPDSPTPSA